MQNNNAERAIKFYRKAIEMIPKDPRPAKECLENLRKGALENLSRLEMLKK